MITLRTSLLASMTLITVTANPANAAVDEYTVEPSQSLEINLDVCSAESQLVVRGDTGTDLDFEVTGPGGESLYSDAGLDDYISLVLENDAGECAQFTLAVSNLGEEKNDFTVVLEPVMAATTRVEKFIIQAESTEKREFKACGTAAKVSARGDGDTDLDFTIRNADGAIVHEDDGSTDQTIVQLDGLLSNCETFEIEVTNLGPVYNALMVVVEPEGADPAQFAGTAPTTTLASTGSRSVAAEKSGPGEYTAAANTQLIVDLPVCGVRRLEVRGSGASDLDFTVSDGSGEEVHSDVDLSDVTFKTLEPGDECETYSLTVNNIGNADNAFEIALIDPATRIGDIGEGEYLINANTSTKVALQVCALTDIRASGGGGTDLDFDVTDSSGSSVHSNYDGTDATEFTLDPQGNCKDYQMSVSNLGSDKNMLTIAFGKEQPVSGVLKQSAPPSVGRTRPVSGIARPGQIVGFRKGEGFGNGELNRNISLLNRTGEALSSLYWSNSATIGWGEDKLSGSTLARNQQWNIEVTDGSQACIFDFRAVTASDREIELGQINVCEESIVTFE